MELETINKLFLELSQIATAKTARELKLEAIADAGRESTSILCHAYHTVLVGELADEAHDAYQKFDALWAKYAGE